MVLSHITWRFKSSSCSLTGPAWAVPLSKQPFTQTIGMWETGNSLPDRVSLTNLKTISAGVKENSVCIRSLHFWSIFHWDIYDNLTILLPSDLQRVVLDDVIFITFNREMVLFNIFYRRATRCAWKTEPYKRCAVDEFGFICSFRREITLWYKPPKYLFRNKLGNRLLSSRITRPNWFGKTKKKTVSRRSLFLISPIYAKA